MPNGLRHVNSRHIAAPPGLSQAVQIISGQPVYISGQVPFDPDGNLVGEGDFRQQVTQVFANIRTILAEFGIGFEQVAKLTYFVTDIRHLATLREVRDTFVDRDHPPASSLIEVSRLFDPRALVEIEAVAVIPA